MMHLRIYVIICLILSSALRLFAQEPAYVPGELIVQLEEGMLPGKIDGIPLREGGGWQFLGYERSISEPMRIYLFRFDPQSNARMVLQQVRQTQGVSWAQFNHYLDLRASTSTLPNDPQFGQQWNLNNNGQNGGTSDADVDAPEAWDLTTGGLSTTGDSLVIAIIDDGFDLNHSDLSFWKNYLEIPDNGLDDDNNGFIDDYDGWNAVLGNGQLSSALHGTHVAGIAAARGDNGLGVSGVNWGLKILPVIATPGTEANAVEGYSYVLEMRRLYDQSNGSEGAYIVATNSSFGINNADPEDFPLWCAMYDSLGRAGIINAVSTMNNGSNVELSGDIPSTCDSEFMIAVTATDRNDQRSGGAAYGPVSIDLGAPGVQVLSTISSNGYGTQTGTSMAAPHVGGALAMLFSYASPDFLQLYNLDAAGTALLIRQLILDGVDTLPNLQGQVVTGGRLNLFRSLQLLDTLQNGLNANCMPPIGLGSRFTTDTATSLFWQAITLSNTYRLRYRPVGGSNWTSQIANDTFLQLGGLTPCQEYEFQVAPDCAAIDYFVFTGFFQTEGCCEPPEGLEVTASTDSSITLNWERVFGANTYILEYQASGENSWENITVNDTSFEVIGLESCRLYAFRIGANCDTIQNGFSAILEESTGNCACTGTAYCIPATGNAASEWIDSVQIGSFSNGSGQNNGYEFFPNLCFSLNPDSSYSVRLIPAYAGFNFREAWRIWLDLNQDGDFEGEEELIFDPNIGSDSIVSGMFTIPSNTFPGPTRLRVGMRFAGFGGVSLPESCESPDFGEFEDYCVTILPASNSCEIPCRLQLSQTDTSTRLLSSWQADPQGSYRLRYRSVNSNVWQYLSVNDTSLILEGLTPCTLYEVGVQKLCIGDSSFFTPTDTLSTLGCSSPLGPEANIQIKYYPNPFQRSIQLVSPVLIKRISLYDLRGRVLRKEEIQQLTTTLAFPDLAPGMYVLRVETLGGIVNTRLIKSK